MKTNKYIFAFLLLILLIPSLNAQDTLFKKYLSISPNGVTYLGDQNGDGYDDFMLYDCNLERAYIFFGGNRMDTIPKFVFNNIYLPDIKVLDVNNDGKLDIIISSSIAPNSNTKIIKVYYGGPKLDTIPNLQFSGPSGSSYWGWSLFTLKDFAGDSHSELMVFDPFLSYSNLPNGCFYFYKTYPQLDTIPYAKIQGDSASHIRYEGSLSSGDINGDGMTDFTLLGFIDTGSLNYDYFRRFYLGNKNFDLTPAVTYYTSQHLFKPKYMQIIKYVNGDHKDDILIETYGNYYPYYYGNSILYGSFPIDTIPRVGLNTQNTTIDFSNIIVSTDYNNDGHYDFLTRTGALTFEAKLWYGRTDMNVGGFELPKKRWGGDFDFFGSLIGKVGDVNGDGLEDYCLGTSSAGSCVKGNVLIFKGDTLYKDTTTDVKNEYIESLGFHLSSAYPNPFNNQVRINYYIGKESEIAIHITNSIGEEVKLLTKGILHAGNYYEQIDMTGKASGVYFITLRAVKGTNIIYSKTEKISLIK
jgi:hypothetical protein